MLATSHLPYPQRAESFTITGAHLVRLAQQCAFRLPQGIVLFGIRAAICESEEGAWQDELVLTESTLDYENFRCTLGVWNTKTHKLAAFPASTVPHHTWIQKQKMNPDVRMANTLSQGLYYYFVGAHEPEQREKEEGAFRLSRLQPVPVWRLLSENAQWTLDQASLDLGVVDDHIHSAQSTAKPTNISYSSAGCQVIKGDHRPQNLPTGPYQQFRIFAGQSQKPCDLEIGLPYYYMLTHARHLMAIREGFDELRLLHGSKGIYVRQLQESLIEQGFLDNSLIDKGDFNGHTALALYRFQKLHAKLTADAIATPLDLKYLGCNLNYL